MRLGITNLWSILVIVLIYGVAATSLATCCIKANTDSHKGMLWLCGWLGLFFAIICLVACLLIGTDPH